MILESGSLKPTARQVKIVREWADDSFTCSFNKCDLEHFSKDVFPRPLCSRSHHEKMIGTAIQLTMKNVEPHCDEYMGDEFPNSKQFTASLFWVVHSREPIHLHAGLHFLAMSAGDWVVFPDSIVHSITATNKWYGVATQIIVEHSFRNDAVKMASYPKYERSAAKKMTKGWECEKISPD